METDTHNNMNTDIELQSSLDTLRDKLKEIENKFEELKHNIMLFCLPFFKKLNS